MFHNYTNITKMIQKYIHTVKNTYSSCLYSRRRRILRVSARCRLVPVSGRTLFPYLGTSVPLTLRTSLPLTSAANVTIVRLRATSDTYVRAGEPQVPQFSVLGDHDDLFRVTANGDVRLAREIDATSLQPGEGRGRGDGGEGAMEG